MRRIYTSVLYLLLPLVLLKLLWRSIRAPAYRRRWKERFGYLPQPVPAHSIWIHAVSVGEVQAMDLVVRQLQKRHPEIPLLVTTSTPTGSQRVRQLFAQSVYHSYFPYDLPACIGRFMRQLQPRMLVLVETEVWPNLLHYCRTHGIPCVLANGRLSARSAEGYRRLGRFIREAFAAIDAVAAQTRDDADRFLALGVAEARVQVTGSIKFDMQVPASILEQIQVIRRNWSEDRPVWVAASTHEGEDEVVLAAHRRIVAQIENALLVLVPRHPERFDKVAGLIQRQGYRFQRRSERQAWVSGNQVLLVDSMGELPVFIGAADVAFIGGSLVPVGGHNMLEAAAQGVPVLFGPHVFNFSAIADLLLKAEAAKQVDNVTQLADQVARLLGDASERSRMGENGRQVVAENRGAAQRLYDLIEKTATQAARGA